MKDNISVFGKVILWVGFLITFGWVTSSFAQAQCPLDNRLVTMSVSDGKYYLPGNYTFKVKFDAPISTDTYKTGNIVQFSVVENVYGVKLPVLKTETEIKNFREKLDKTVNSYKFGTDIILEHYQLRLNEIRESDQTENRKDKEAGEQRKANEVDSLNTETAKQLEELYAVKTKSIEYLFSKTVHPNVTPEIKEDFDSKISIIEVEFKSEIKELRKDPTEKVQVEQLIREYFKKFQELANLEKIELEGFKKGKAERFKNLSQEIEEKFKKDTLEIEQTFENDLSKIKVISDTDLIKKSESKELEKDKAEILLKEKVEILKKDKAEKLEKLEKDKIKELENLSKMPEVITVIPKAAKGFGKVERAKRQLPLFINYKARISVVLDYVLLDNGDCIPIEVAVSPDIRLYNEGDPDIGNVIDCKSDGLSGKKCIKGRRPIYNFVSPILSGIAAVAAVLLKNDTTKALAGFTAVDQLTKGDLGNVINGADALISDKLIYEVETRNSSIGTFKKEEKKEEKK